MESLLNLSDMQLDAIREIGNIGAGNSATALSQLINKKIDMNVPKVSVVPLGEIPDLVGGPDRMVAGIFLRVYGKAPGSVLFLMTKESALYLSEKLVGVPKDSIDELTEMDQSAIMEIGNILTGAYLNALSYYTKLTLLPSIPSMAVDMAGAILNIIIAQLGEMGDHALVIETQFLSEDDGINGQFFLVPDPGSLQIILNAIGVK